MSRRPQRRLLTVGHSFVLRSNRRLAECIQDASNGSWRVTVAAPRYYQGNPRYGDLKPEHLKIEPDETVEVVGVPVFLSNRVHFASYGLQLKTLMGSGFEAIHCWEEPYIFSGAQMARWASPNALLTYLTFQNLDKIYPPPFNWLERRVLGCADGWVAGANLVERALKDRPGYRELPYRLIGFGVDPRLFKHDASGRAALRASLGWNDDVPVVGYLGRLTDSKGVPLLMRVLERIKRPWRAMFVGTGAHEAALRMWAKKFKKRVHIATDIGHESVPATLSAMDVLIAPSQTTPIWREQFGRVLIEAFACRIPVVASDSGEIPYVLGDAGRLVPERDEALFQRAIEELLDDPTLRAEFASKGFERVQKHFTWEAIGKKYVDFFDELEAIRRDGRPRIRATGNR
jgi:glycosyltransferase involved in cell wall biosynthesis